MDDLSSYLPAYVWKPKRGLILSSQPNIKKWESERQSWEGWCQKACAQRDLGQDSPKNRGHVWLMILKIILKNNFWYF